MLDLVHIHLIHDSWTNRQLGVRVVHTQWE